MQERIQKIIANSGVASRRKAEELIKSGLVKVNGKTAKLGDKSDYETDKIEVGGNLIRKEKKVYIIINKPKGVISSVKDYRGRKTVVDLVKTKERIFPVGRLDLDTEGLLILTNDGDFANNITHPRYNIKKKYCAVLDKELSEEDIEMIRKGVGIDGRKVIVSCLESRGNKVTLSIHEGRKHVIKRLFKLLGYDVVQLKRSSIGNLSLNLNPGEYRFVSGEWLKDIIKKAKDI